MSKTAWNPDLHCYHRHAHSDGDAGHGRSAQRPHTSSMTLPEGWVGVLLSTYVLGETLCAPPRLSKVFSRKQDRRALRLWFKQEFIPVQNKDTMKTWWAHQQASGLHAFLWTPGGEWCYQLGFVPACAASASVPQHFRRSELQAICYCCFGSCFICGRFPWPGVPRTVRQQETECVCVALSPDFPFHRHLRLLPAHSAGWLRGRWPDFVTWAKGPVWNN